MQSLPIPTGTNPWLIRLLTLLLAALASASALFWVLKWPNQSAPVRSTVAEPQAQGIDSSKIASLLGARQTGAGGPEPAINPGANFKLMGVIAQGGQGSRGSALIAVESVLAKPFKVGDTVADGLILQSVTARTAVLGHEGQAGGTITLELPPLPGLPSAQ